MTIEEIYQKYKHMDTPFSDKDLITTFAHKVVYDIWQAVKSEAESAKAEPAESEYDYCEIFTEGNTLKYRREYLSEQPIEHAISEADFDAFLVDGIPSYISDAASMRAKGKKVVLRFRKEVR